MYGYLMAMNLSFLEGKFKAKSCECNVRKKKVSYNVWYPMGLAYIPSFVHSFNIAPRWKRTNLKPSFLEILIDSIVSREEDKTLTCEKEKLKTIWLE